MLEFSNLGLKLLSILYSCALDFLNCLLISSLVFPLFPVLCILIKFIKAFLSFVDWEKAHDISIGTFYSILGLFSLIFFSFFKFSHSRIISSLQIEIFISVLLLIKIWWCSSHLLMIRLGIILSTNLSHFNPGYELLSFLNPAIAKTESI